MKVFVKHYFDKNINSFFQEVFNSFLQEVFVEGNYDNGIMNITETRSQYIKDKNIEITTFDRNFTLKELDDFIKNTSFNSEQKLIYEYALNYMKEKENPKS